MTKGIAILLLMVSVLLLKQNTVTASQRTNPLVINTWWFINATKRGKYGHFYLKAENKVL